MGHNDSITQLRVLYKWWRHLSIYAWIVFIGFQIGIGVDRYTSDSPICSYEPTLYPPIYWRMMYFIEGGFVMILANIVIRFLTTNENDTHKYFIYWISLHIIGISTISTLLTTIYNWGGICIDSLSVASSASVWGEWIACTPLILFITTTMTHKDEMIQLKDAIICILFTLSLFIGFSTIYVSYTLGIFLFCFAILCAVPAICISVYYTVEDEQQSYGFNVYKQYKYISRSITVIFPFFILNYLLSVSNLYSNWITIIVYQLLSLLTKGLFVSFIMDIHLNVLIDVDKALIREKLANETRRSFMKYIFHEVRTPLNSLSIGIDYLQESMDHEASVRQTLTSMQSSCLYMSETLNNVLNLHKIEEHKWDVEMSPFSIKEVIRDIQSTFRSVISSKKITLIHHAIDDTIVSDRIKIQHILSNLVSNAVKFTSSNGCITIKIEKDEISEPHRLIMTVKDTGCGISAEHQQKLFMNYSQIRPNIIQSGGGSGLGLMYCKQIAQLLQGDVIIKHTEVNKGTTFECVIPARFKPAMIEMSTTGATLVSVFTPKTVSIPIKNDLRILIVDDHEASRKIFSMYLKKLGMETICYAEDGVIGLEMVKKGMECFNVLIVDNLMPNMTGVDMTRQLRLLGYPYLIIGLTGNVMEQDMNEFTEAGADYVLMKPVNMADVRGLITFMNDHGSISRTNSATKLMLTNHHFRWVAITPVMT